MSEDGYSLMATAGALYARVLLEHAVKREIDQVYLGPEALHFDFGPILIPGPGGQGMAGYLLILSCKSPLLTPPRIALPEIIADAYPSDSQIKDAVTKALATLIDARARLLRPQPGGGYHPGAN